MNFLSKKKRHDSFSSTVASTPSSAAMNHSSHNKNHINNTMNHNDNATPINNIKNETPPISPQLLSLTLENSSLRSELSTLRDSLDPTHSTTNDHSLNMLSQQNEALQRKLREMAEGLTEIERERKILKRSCEGWKMDLKRVQGELEGRERHLKMREKEVGVLSERVREQERRIESLVEEGMGYKRQVEGLEKEKEGLREESKRWEDRIREANVREEGLEADLKRVNSLVEMEKNSRINDCEKWTRLEKMMIREVDSIKEEKQRMERELQLEYSKRMQEAEMERRKMERELRCDLEEKESTIQSLNVDLQQQEEEVGLLRQCQEEIVQEKDGEIRKWRKREQELTAEIEAAHESKSTLEGELFEQRGKEQELTAACARIDGRNWDLLRELDAVKNELASRNFDVCTIQHRRDELEEELTSSKLLHSQSRADVERLTSRIDDLEKALEDERLEHSKRIVTIEAELKKESDRVHELRARLERVESDSKREGASSRDVVGKLELAIKSQSAQHRDKIDALLREHGKELADIETRGADVVSDLEESIASLEKELVDNKCHYELALAQLHQKISQSCTDNELLDRQVKENEKKAKAQDDKIRQLSTLGQHRGEEIVALQTELGQVRTTLAKTCSDNELLERQVKENETSSRAKDEKIRQLSSLGQLRGEEIVALQMELGQVRALLAKIKREHDNAVNAISVKLEDASHAYERKVKEMQLSIDDACSQLSAANKRLAAEDGELNTVKSKLVERTNLLREMVTQTKSYQADYEREHARANQLNEAVESYKSQLNEAKSLAQRQEKDSQDKERHLRETTRTEREQRKVLESKSELLLQNMDELARKNGDMEKENAVLKDKISRQENYIVRLQNREKQERERRRGPPVLGMSSANRPATAGSRSVSVPISPMSCVLLAGGDSKPLAAGRVPRRAAPEDYDTDENVRPG